MPIWPRLAAENIDGHGDQNRVCISFMHALRPIDGRACCCRIWENGEGSYLGSGLDYWPGLIEIYVGQTANVDVGLSY